MYRTPNPEPEDAISTLEVPLLKLTASLQTRASGVSQGAEFRPPSLFTTPKFSLGGALFGRGGGGVIQLSLRYVRIITLPSPQLASQKAFPAGAEKFDKMGVKH